MKIKNTASSRQSTHRGVGSTECDDPATIKGDFGTQGTNSDDCSERESEISCFDEDSNDEDDHCMDDSTSDLSESKKDVASHRDKGGFVRLRMPPRYPKRLRIESDRGNSKLRIRISTSRLLPIHDRSKIQQQLLSKHGMYMNMFVTSKTSKSHDFPENEIIPLQNLQPCTDFVMARLRNFLAVKSQSFDYILELSHFEVYSFGQSWTLPHGRIQTPIPHDFLNSEIPLETSCGGNSGPTLKIPYNHPQFLDPLDILHVVRDGAPLLSSLTPTPKYSPIYSMGNFMDIDYAFLLNCIRRVGKPDGKRVSQHGRRFGIGYLFRIHDQFSGTKPMEGYLTDEEIEKFTSLIGRLACFVFAVMQEIQVSAEKPLLCRDTIRDSLYAGRLRQMLDIDIGTAMGAEAVFIGCERLSVSHPGSDENDRDILRPLFADADLHVDPCNCVENDFSKTGCLNRCFLDEDDGSVWIFQLILANRASIGYHMREVGPTLNLIVSEVKAIGMEVMEMYADVLAQAHVSDGITLPTMVDFTPLFLDERVKTSQSMPPKGGGMMEISIEHCFHACASPYIGMSEIANSLVGLRPYYENCDILELCLLASMSQVPHCFLGGSLDFVLENRPAQVGAKWVDTNVYGFPETPKLCEGMQTTEIDKVLKQASQVAAAYLIWMNSLGYSGNCDNGCGDSKIAIPYVAYTHDVFCARMSQILKRYDRSELAYLTKLVILVGLVQPGRHLLQLHLPCVQPSLLQRMNKEVEVSSLDITELFRAIAAANDIQATRRDLISHWLCGCSDPKDKNI